MAKGSKTQKKEEEVGGERFLATDWLSGKANYIWDSDLYT